MKKLQTALFAFFLILCSSNRLIAYPTSLFWTTCTTDVIDTGMASFQVSNYFTVFNRVHRGQVFPVDVGLGIGLFSWGDWEMEGGADYLGGLDYPWLFNAKIGIEEDKLFVNAPGFSIGIFDVGTRAGVTNFNVVNPNIGKTLPDWLFGGKLFVGAYVGSHTLGRDQGGFMVGYTQNFCPATDCHGVDYWKWWLVADYASGKNFIGGGGVGIAYFFTPYAWIITGPTGFNDAHVNGRWKWSVQINILFSVFQTCKRNSGRDQIPYE